MSFPRCPYDEHLGWLCLYAGLLDLRNPADIRIINAEKNSCGFVDVSQSHKQEKTPLCHL